MMNRAPLLEGSKANYLAHHIPQFCFPPPHCSRLLEGLPGFLNAVIAGFFCFLSPFLLCSVPGAALLLSFLASGEQGFVCRLGKQLMSSSTR